MTMCVASKFSRLLVCQTPAGGSEDVGREQTNDIHFCPIFYRCIVDKKKNLVLLQGTLSSIIV
jgi:hypothetical protein